MRGWVDQWMDDRIEGLKGWMTWVHQWMDDRMDGSMDG